MKKTIGWLFAQKREITSDDWQELESLVDSKRPPQQGEPVNGYLSPNGESEYDFIDHEWRPRRK